MTYTNHLPNFITIKLNVIAHQANKLHDAPITPKNEFEKRLLR